MVFRSVGQLYDNCLVRRIRGVEEGLRKLRAFHVNDQP